MCVYSHTSVIVCTLEIRVISSPVPPTYTKWVSEIKLRLSDLEAFAHRVILPAPIGHFKYMNYIVCRLYLNQIITLKKWQILNSQPKGTIELR